MKPSTYLSILFLFLFSSQLSLKAQDYRYGKVSKEELQEKVHPIDSNANAAILYREIKSSFDYSDDDGFYITHDVFERVKIYNKDGYDWGSQSINLYKNGRAKEKISSLKGYTYTLVDDKIEEQKLKKNGIFEEETTKYLEKTKFTMPNIQDGCVLEYKYSIKTPFKYSIDLYGFQEKIPVNKVYIRFTTPEYYNYKMHQKGWIPFKIDTDKRERTLSYSYTTQPQRGQAVPQRNKTQATFFENIYSVDIENVPPIKKEKYSGNIENFMSSLSFELSFVKFPNSPIETFSTSWEVVTRTIYDATSFGDQLDRTSYFKEDIDALISGVSNDDEKMIRIFEFVKNKMNWNSFFGYTSDEGVKNAYKNNSGNSGDINLMLIAMLRYAGLKANPVLISTKSNGIPLFPTRDGFNFVIGAVENKSGIYLMDATNKLGEPNILETELLNWQGRIIRQDLSSTWISLEPNVPAVRNCMLTAIINQDLSILGTSQNRYTGHYALSERKKYQNVEKDELRKQIEKKLADVEISELSYKNLDKLYQPVSLSYEFETFDAVEEVSGKLYFSPLLFKAIDENPFKLEDRKYPIDFEHPIKDRYLVKYEIPEGYSIESMPESTSFSLPNNMGSYRYAISNTGNVLQLSSELAINTSLISPEMYLNLKKFFELVVQKENEKVVLTKI